MSAIIQQLEQAIGSDAVLTDGETLASRRHDYWVLSHLADVQQRPAPDPLCVVRPTSVEQVQAVVNLARESGTALTPFGLGSGVVGGVIADPDTIILDMSAMNQVREVDEHNLIAHFDAGKNGLEAEQHVQQSGLTIGHWPQSIALSSVGGWVTMRASGQFSTAHGNIEDIIYGVEAVLPDGTLVNAGKAPRASAGPDLRHVFLGSEGTLGVITGVSLGLRRLPEAQAFSVYYCKNMAHGLEAQRQIIHAGWTPPVMRQYDLNEVKRLFPDQLRGEDGLLLLVHEGPVARVEVEKAAIAKLMAEQGLNAGPEDAATKWFEDRNHVPHWDEFLGGGVILDTIEVSAPWDKIDAVYNAAILNLMDVPGIVNASAHSSHAYRTGINLYFTFAAIPENKDDMADTYRDCWRRVLEATAENGGGIAHHHGIGRVRKDYLHHDLGDGGMHLLRQLKRSLDPTGIFNPGVLIDG